jgi:hypothetical protein
MCVYTYNNDTYIQVGLQSSVGHIATYSSAIVITTLAAESYVVFVGAGVCVCVFVGAGVSSTRPLLLRF